MLQLQVATTYSAAAQTMQLAGMKDHCMRLESCLIAWKRGQTPQVGMHKDHLRLRSRPGGGRRLHSSCILIPQAGCGSCSPP